MRKTNTRNAFIRQMLENERLIEASPEFSYKALVKSRQDYDELYRRSIEEPEAFWGQMASENLDWYRGWDAVEEYDFSSDEPFVRYFRGGQINVSYNCLDRHLEARAATKAALIWQGNLRRKWTSTPTSASTARFARRPTCCPVWA